MASACNSAPYISLVIAARNDNHGGAMLVRMQAFLDCWIAQAKRYALSSEIIVVEWNPPADRPKLAAELNWPDDTSHCEVRFVEVPAEVHQRFPHVAAIPLHQMIAKNVGIRRARGQFVLVSNLDIVFSPALMRFLAERRLKSGTMYRLDRLDVASNLPVGAGVDEILQFCENHVLRVCAREGGFSLDAGGLPVPVAEDIFASESGLRPISGWHNVERSDSEVYRWTDPDAEFLFQRPCHAPPRLMMNLETGPSAGLDPVTLQVADQAGHVLAATTVTGRTMLRLHQPAEVSSGHLILKVRAQDVPLISDPRILNLRFLRMEWDSAPAVLQPSYEWMLETVSAQPGSPWHTSHPALSFSASGARRAAYLHTNACGDFTLLSRDDWFSLRGYPEFPVWPMHIDALFCYSAFHAGMAEEILRDPMRIYHLEHLSGAGWTPEGENVRNARLRAKGLSEMQFSEVTKWINQMRRYQAPVIYTLGNWGLADVEFQETAI